MLILASNLLTAALMADVVACQSDDADSCCSDKHLGCLKQKPLKRAPLAYVYLSKQSPTLSHQHS